MLRVFPLALLPLLMLALAASADLPSIRLDRMYPLGAAAGSTIEVEVQGAEFEEVRELKFDHPGIKAEWLKDKKFKVAVDAGVPAGSYDCWAVGRFGVSNPRLFAISRGFKEVDEKEPNDDDATAQAVEINTIINGTSDNSKEDIFKFAAKKNQRVTIACNAARLDSQLDAVLSVYSKSGKQIASNGDYDGRDPFVDVLITEDGEYFIRLSDLSFKGGLPYRLVISDKPQLENVFPRVVKSDTDAEIVLLGRNFGPSATESKWTIQDLALQETKAKVRATKDILSLGKYKFLEHPTSHSVVPTAATCTLNGFQDALVVNNNTLITTPILVSPHDVTLEAEPNDTLQQAQKLTLPAVVSGRFDRERDGDWYVIEPTETGVYSIEVYSERIAGRADPYVFIQDEKGNKVVELDDFGHRMNAFDGHLRDPSGIANLNAKMKYHVFVQDRYRRGGARFQYVLAINKQEFEFHIASMHSLNPGPAGLNIYRGGSAYLNFVIHQRGPTSPITVRAENLPPGVTAQDVVLRDNTKGVMVFHADKQAKETTVPIKLVASSKRGEVLFEREVRAYTRVSSDANPASSRPMRIQWLAVREAAPFALAMEKTKVEVDAGQKVEMKVKLERHWPDFKSQVTLQSLEFPGSVKMNNVVLPADKNEVLVTIEVQANAAGGEYTLAISGQAQVPYNKVATETTKPNTLVTQPSKPFTIIVKAKEEKKK